MPKRRPKPDASPSASPGVTAANGHAAPPMGVLFADTPIDPPPLPGVLLTKDGKPRKRAPRGTRPVAAPARLASLCALPDDEKLAEALRKPAPKGALKALRLRVARLDKAITARIAELQAELAEL